MKHHNIPRLFISSSLNYNNIINLSLEQHHYLKNVLRLKDGEIMRIFNNNDGEFYANIKYNKKNAELVVREFIKVRDTPKYEITLAPCIIKPENLSIIFDMATQLGVNKFQPIISDRTQNRSFNYTRFSKIIVEAAEQSERLDVPELFSPQPLRQFINDAAFDLLIWGNETLAREEQPSSLPVFNKGERIIVLIGPEGGLSSNEKELLSSLNNNHGISLGRNILRAETAAVTLLNFLNYHLFF